MNMFVTNNGYTSKELIWSSYELTIILIIALPLSITITIQNFIYRIILAAHRYSN